MAFNERQEGAADQPGDVGARIGRRKPASTGSVCTMSPSELGLMMRMRR